VGDLRENLKVPRFARDKKSARDDRYVVGGNSQIHFVNLRDKGYNFIYTPGLWSLLPGGFQARFWKVNVDRQLAGKTAHLCKGVCPASEFSRIAFSTAYQEN
jgi:hypothetical protein